jgi:hypothetical protein
MSDREIRMFDVDRGREGDINYAVVCNGRTHFVCREALAVPHRNEVENTHCDGESCQGPGSEPVDTSLLSIESQEHLGLTAYVPRGLVLVTKASRDLWPNRDRRTYSGGEEVPPKQLEIGTLLAEGEGSTFVEKEYRALSVYRARVIYYVRNVGGKPEVCKVGKEGRKKTTRKLAKLKRGERKSEVSYEVTLLNERLIELMQLHRTPEVHEEIENVKELLRLAASLSVEASIDAAEGNEQIARELANSRAREIGAELQQTRERLMLEKRVREEVQEELNDRYDN